MNVLRELISRTNIYINSRGRDLNVKLVETIAQWVGKMLRMFGLGEGERSELGWGQVDESGDGANVSISRTPLEPTLNMEHRGRKSLCHTCERCLRSGTTSEN